MLRLSRKAEYGIIALKNLLSRPGGQTCSAREIAERYNIPVELMAKVLQKLAKDGLLESAQAVYGGYVLAVPASKNCVADVVESIDGPIGIVVGFQERALFGRHRSGFHRRLARLRLYVQESERRAHLRLRQFFLGLVVLPSRGAWMSS